MFDTTQGWFFPQSKMFTIYLKISFHWELKAIPPWMRVSCIEGSRVYQRKAHISLESRNCKNEMLPMRETLSFWYNTPVHCVWPGMNRVNRFGLWGVRAASYLKKQVNSSTWAIVMKFTYWPAEKNVVKGVRDLSARG